MATGWALSSVGKAIVMVVVLVVVIMIGYSLMSGSSGQASALFAGIPGLPEPAPELKTGLKIAGDSCRFSEECSEGLACYKGEAPSRSFGKCVKAVEWPPTELKLSAKALPVGACGSGSSAFVSDAPRESWAILKPGYYIIEVSSDGIVYQNCGDKTNVFKSPSIGQEPNYMPDITKVIFSIFNSAYPGYSRGVPQHLIVLDSSMTYVVRVPSTIPEITVYGVVGLGSGGECNKACGWNVIRIYKLSDKCGSSAWCDYLPPTA